MQDHTPASLNALRVFLVVAQHGSIKSAAGVLHVTPGAVSHQVRVLEDALGVDLLRRTHNAITLTPAGQQLFEEATPGVKLVQAALDRARRGADELRVQASMTLATRWLIPKLQDFQDRNPSAQIRVETTHDINTAADPDADIFLGYHAWGHLPPDADVLMEDACRPYVAPGVLTALRQPTSVASIPALQCTPDNWDWTLWGKRTGRAGDGLRFAGRFDLDDAALRAAVGGMGMVLAADFMVADDVALGHLCPVPGAAQAVLGYYVVHHNAHETRLSRRFVKWLRQVAAH